MENRELIGLLAVRVMPVGPIMLGGSGRLNLIEARAQIESALEPLVAQFQAIGQPSRAALVAAMVAAFRAERVILSDQPAPLLETDESAIAGALETSADPIDPGAAESIMERLEEARDKISALMVNGRDFAGLPDGAGRLERASDIHAARYAALRAMLRALESESVAYYWTARARRRLRPAALDS